MYTSSYQRKASEARFQLASKHANTIMKDVKVGDLIVVGNGQARRAEARDLDKRVSRFMMTRPATRGEKAANSRKENHQAALRELHEKQQQERETWLKQPGVKDAKRIVGMLEWTQAEMDSHVKLLLTTFGPEKLKGMASALEKPRSRGSKKLI